MQGGSKYEPGEGAILHSLLAVLPPAITVFQMIHLALGQKRESWLPLALLPFLLPSLRIRSPLKQKYQNVRNHLDRLNSSE